MTQHYNQKFYDKLDDIIYLLESTLFTFEEQKDSITQTINESENNPGLEINIIKSFLHTTSLTKTVPVLDNLIEAISSSVLEKSKVYSDINKMIQIDEEVLKDCRKDIVAMLEKLEEEKKIADEWEVPLLDHLEEKLSDVNVIILDAFF